LKGYVLWALAAVGDPAAYEAVKGWLDEHLRKLEKNPEGDSLGTVVFAVAYLEQMTERHPDVIALLDRFKLVAPKLRPHIRGQLGHYTRMFTDGKQKHRRG
jgi:hypothetical protein